MAAKKTVKKDLTLGLCTSGSKVKMALLAGDRFYGSSRKCLNQEKALFPMIDRLLAKEGALLRDVGALCVVTGPGRFTGLRVGLTLASALKTLAGVEIRTATLFDVLAEQAVASAGFRAWAEARKEPRLAAVTHAFKDEYYCQVFRAARRAGGFRFAAIEGPRWLKEAELTEYLRSFGPLYLAADAEEKTDIYAVAPAEAVKAPPRISKIIPEFVIRAGLALKKRDLSPLYLKPAKYEAGEK